MIMTGLCWAPFPKGRSCNLRRGRRRNQSFMGNGAWELVITVPLKRSKAVQMKLGFHSQQQGSGKKCWGGSSSLTKLARKREVMEKILLQAGTGSRFLPRELSVVVSNVLNLPPVLLHPLRPMHGNRKGRVRAYLPCLWGSCPETTDYWRLEIS